MPLANANILHDKNLNPLLSQIRDFDWEVEMNVDSYQFYHMVLWILDHSFSVSFMTQNKDENYVALLLLDEPLREMKNILPFFNSFA